MNRVYKCICKWDERKYCGCFRSGVCDKPQEEQLHPHNDGLDEYREPKKCCQCGACPGGCIAEAKP